MFQDKHAVVTGGASGIGAALCRALAARGATVIVADRNTHGAATVAREIGDAATPATVDVADAEGVTALLDAQPRLDLVVNNAGIAVGGEVHRLDLDHWKRTLDVNLGGVIHGVHAAYPRMLEQGSGVLVNVASLAAIVHAPGWAPYAASKAAVLALSMSLRAEAQARGVQVNVVCPGLVDTPIPNTGSFVGLESPEAREAFVKAAWPFAPGTSEQAAIDILTGIERNDPFIFTPAKARHIWRMSRWFPGMTLKGTARAADDVRKATGG